MAERVVERTLSDGGLSIHYRLERLGGDLLLTVTGGAAHVGCVVLATHRQSLTGSGADSADSSVFNRSGHKDEFLLRALADRLCRGRRGRRTLRRAGPAGTAVRRPY